MKIMKSGVPVIPLVCAILIFAIPQKLYAADTNAAVNKNSLPVKEHKDKIAVEREAIIEDGRKLQEARKTGDKALIERVKKETDQDIEKRKATIKALYKDMDKKPLVGGTKKSKNLKMQQ